MVGGIFGRAYNSYGSSTGKTQLSGFVNSGAITGTGDYVDGVIGYCYGYSGSYIQDANTSSGKIFGKVENVTTK